MYMYILQKAIDSKTASVV